MDANEKFESLSARVVGLNLSDDQDNKPQVATKAKQLANQGSTTKKTCMKRPSGRGAGKTKKDESALSQLMLDMMQQEKKLKLVVSKVTPKERQLH